MRVIGSFGWYSHYMKNLRVNCKPLHELTHDNTPFHWTNEHDQVFKQIKEDISSGTVLAIPDVSYPFHIHLDSSNVGTFSILIQEFRERKGLFLSIREFSTKLNKNYQPCIESYVELFLFLKRTNTI